MTSYPDDITQRQLGTPEQDAQAQVGEWPGGHRPIVIVDYDADWPAQFSAAAEVVRSELGPLVVSIEHVGSTSVPGLAAKPVIDIDLLIPATADESVYVPALAQAGYVLVLREPWWFGHRLLVSSEGDVNLHVWPQDAAEPVRHRLFRDWLRTHPSDRELYESAKRHVADETTDRPGEYSMGKNDAIDAIFARIFAAG